RVFKESRRFGGVPFEPPFERGPTFFAALVGLAGLGFDPNTLSWSPLTCSWYFLWSLILSFSSSLSCLSMAYSSNIASNGTPS
ncbi:hypothetical protein PJI21_29250, partial [Mycobacterium kansasii]